jgi:hypothetical protein
MSNYTNFDNNVFITSFNIDDIIKLDNITNYDKRNDLLNIIYENDDKFCHDKNKNILNSQYDKLVIYGKMISTKSNENLVIKTLNNYINVIIKTIFDFNIPFPQFNNYIDGYIYGFVVSYDNYCKRQIINYVNMTVNQRRECERKPINLKLSENELRKQPCCSPDWKTHIEPRIKMYKQLLTILLHHEYNYMEIFNANKNLLKLMYIDGKYNENLNYDVGIIKGLNFNNIEQYFEYLKEVKRVYNYLK